MPAARSYEVLSAASSSDGRSLRASIRLLPSQSVIRRSGFCATKALYSLRAMSSGLSSMPEVGVLILPKITLLAPKRRAKLQFLW